MRYSYHGNIMIPNVDHLEHFYHLNHLDHLASQVQPSTHQYCLVELSTVNYNTSTAQHSSLEPRKARYSPVQPSAAQ